MPFYIVSDAIGPYAPTPHTGFHSLHFAAPVGILLDRLQGIQDARLNLTGQAPEILREDASGDNLEGSHAQS
jgi:hypothetical protein